MKWTCVSVNGRCVIAALDWLPGRLTVDRFLRRARRCPLAGAELLELRAAWRHLEQLDKDAVRIADEHARPPL